MPKGFKCEQTSRVLKWLNSIPETAQGNTQTPRECDADHEFEDALKNIHVTCDEECEFQAKFENHSRDTRSGKDSESMLFLQGSPCNINSSQSKHIKSTKRVTFNISDNTCEMEDATSNIGKELTEAKRGKVLDEDRFVLVRNMQDYLKDVAKKRSEKLCYRNKSYTKDLQPEHKNFEKYILQEKNDAQRSDTCTINREELGMDGEAKEFDDIICVGRQGSNVLFSADLRKPSVPAGIESIQMLQSRFRLPLWGAKVPHIYRKAQGRPKSKEKIDRNRNDNLPKRSASKRPLWDGGKNAPTGSTSRMKPLIKGLVVDAATNQQPSIVRASKNANIREEHALKIRIGGFEKECSQNINNIRLAQRKMNANLAYLKSKKVATSAARAKAEEENQEQRHELSPDDMTGFSALPLCFPPLVYRNRRVLTVSS